MGLLGVDFGAWRASWEAELEDVAIGYESEGADFRRDNPAPTFKAYLIAHTGAGWPMSGQEPKRRDWSECRDPSDIW